MRAFWPGLLGRLAIGARRGERSATGAWRGERSATGARRGERSAQPARKVCSQVALVPSCPTTSRG